MLRSLQPPELAWVGTRSTTSHPALCPVLILPGETLEVLLSPWTLFLHL